MNAKEKPRTVGLNIEIPVDIHRRAKAAAVLSDMGWNEAVAAALDLWARSAGVTAASKR